MTNNESPKVENTFIFHEKYVEEGLSAARTNSNKYSYLVILIIMTANLATHASMSFHSCTFI